MPFRYLPDVALADIAFEAEGSTISELFQACALALTDIMVDPSTLDQKVTKELSIEADDADRLLYDFLTELIVLKDVDSLLFKEYAVRVSEDVRSMTVKASGEPIDRDRHLLRNDVKAVTMHMFGVARQGSGWKATVVLDI